MKLNGSLYINGRWLPGAGDKLISINPADNQEYWQGTSATTTEIDLAIDSARTAFPGWADKSLEDRLTIIKEYQSVLKEYESEFAMCISDETGKALWESKTEVATMIGKVDLSIKSHAARTPTQAEEMGAGQRLLTHRPHGVVAVFGPYNFPGHLPNGHIVPALIAGNTVVYKPSELTPAVAEMMTRCWDQAGLPAGVLNLVYGEKDTGVMLAGHTGIDGLFFTGSSGTGNILSRQFANTPEKILALEMGGNNPLVITNISDLDAVTYNIVQSAFISAGQRCTCARRLIIVKDAHTEALLEQLTEVSSNIVVGDPKDDVFYGPVINNSAAEQLLQAQQTLIDQGGTSLLTMTRPKTDLPYLTPGIVDISDCTDIKDEEFFGPLLQVKIVNDFEDAIEAANNTSYGLAAGLISDSETDWQKFYRLSRAGIVNWNKPTTGASGAAPFGGSGNSGNHRPSAWYAADYCAYPVASVIEDKVSLPDTLSPGLSM